MAEQFGSGIYLDEDFDFSVSAVGDLQMTDGIDELQKDLAIQMVINISQYLGASVRGNIEAKVSATAERVAEADPRVLRVRSKFTEVSFSSSRQEITLKMTVQTPNTEQELIFEV